MRGISQLLWAMLLVPVLLLAACGDDDDGGGGGTAGGGGAGADTVGGDAASGDVRAKERAFLEAMVPHHESALDMAQVAEGQAESPEIKKIARQIAEAQGPEIRQMQDIHRRLFGSALLPKPEAHEELGLSPEEAGAGHGDAAVKLERTDPFDRAFVDEMVPHHQGAIRMAQAVLAVTDDAELRELAQRIVETQQREIEDMSSFREERYGGPVRQPGEHGGGAVPAPDGHGGGHD